MEKKKGLLKSYEVKSYEERGDKFIVKGWASKAIVDRVNDIVLPTAFLESVKRFRENPKLAPSLRLNHSFPIGRLETLEIQSDGVWVEASIAKGFDEADKARRMVKEDVLRFFSIGFIPLETEYEDKDDKEIRIIKNLDLLEVSLVDVPACQEAVFEFDGKSIAVKPLTEEEQNMEEKKVSGKTTWPLADRRRSWDDRAADARIRKWASSDGSGDPDKMDWKKYQSVHFWYDENAPDQFTSYKLLFCDVINGKVYAIPRAIFAVAVVLQGGRRGVKIPEKDRPGVMKKVEIYYRKMGEEAPWNRKDETFFPFELIELMDNDIELWNEKFAEMQKKLNEYFSKIESIEKTISEFRSQKDKEAESEEEVKSFLKELIEIVKS